MNYNQKNPTPFSNDGSSSGGHVMMIEAFQSAVGKGLFLKDDVFAFWATETHFDANLSVWVYPQPPEATRVVLFAVPPPSGIIPPSSSA